MARASHWVRRYTALVVLATGIGSGLIGVVGSPPPAGASWPHTVSSAAPNPAGPGYWDVYSDGTVTANGGVSSYGDMAGQSLNSPIIGITPTPSGAGYWLLGSDGGIFSFGNAAFHGSTGSMRLNKPVVDMASSSDGGGYWLVGSDGGIFTYGDAVFHGSAGSLHLNAAIVGMAANPDGGGYWLVASDGGIFTYGDAVFHGSTGSMHLNAPIVGMAATPDGGGYWLVGSDGGVFSFGNAQFFGSDPGHGITSPAVGMVRSQSGGYTVILANGQVAAYQSSLSITTTSLQATQGQQCDFQLGAAGGTGPYTWSITGGSPPSGLSLSLSGVLSGLATAPSSSPFTVSLRDATGAVVSEPVTLDVAAAPTTLAPGQQLNPGQSIWSDPNGYWAVMQGDGNFVIYNSANGQALWATFTGVAGSHIVMQGDGNLVIYTPGGTAVWSSGTAGNWGVYASMQGDSNFVLYGPSGRALWDYASGLLGTSVSTLYTGQTLATGQQLWSYDGAYEVVMQGDGNLVLYHDGSALWSTGTSGSNFHLSMQGDGNLVVYSAGGVAQWNSGTSGADFYAVIQVDSNFVIYSPTNGAQWDYGSGLLSSGGGGTSTGQKIVNAAASQAGVQYCFDGGNQFGPTSTGCASGVGFDCTGLTMYAVYQATGIVLPHSSAQGADGGGTEITSQSALEPGDLVFFGGTYDDFEHSGIYAGGGLFWDANDYGIPVQEHSIAWETSGSGGLAFVGGERF
jgi:cell wall-associated NlpC family hydrolase